MKFSIARGELLDALSAASRALSSRSTLPILSGVLIEASGDHIVVQATDLEISVKHSVSAGIESEGSAVLPGKLTADIVRSLTEAAVVIEVEKDKAQITSESSSFSVKTLSPEDFPKFPEVEPDRKAILQREAFTSLVTHVSKAVSRDETRPILTGALMALDGPVFRMVATDSYRLAVKEIVLEKPPAEEIEVVVPGRALDEVGRLAADESIEVGVSENQVVFSFGKTVFVTRRIEGAFPNWRQLIPKEEGTVLTVNLEEISQAAKRVSLLAQHNTPVRMAASSANQTVTLSATTQDIGEASDDLMAEVSGDDVEIAFNHGFLADGLAVAKGEKVTFDISSPLKPGVMKAPEDEGFLYLLMPVRLG